MSTDRVAKFVVISAGVVGAVYGLAWYCKRSFDKYFTLQDDRNLPLTVDMVKDRKERLKQLKIINLEDHVSYDWEMGLRLGKLKVCTKTETTTTSTEEKKNTTTSPDDLVEFDDENKTATVKSPTGTVTFSGTGITLITHNNGKQQSLIAEYECTLPKDEFFVLKVKKNMLVEYEPFATIHHGDAQHQAFALPHPHMFKFAAVFDHVSASTYFAEHGASPTNHYMTIDTIIKKYPEMAHKFTSTETNKQLFVSIQGWTNTDPYIYMLCKFNGSIISCYNLMRTPYEFIDKLDNPVKPLYRGTHEFDRGDLAMCPSKYSPNTLLLMDAYGEW